MPQPILTNAELEKIRDVTQPRLPAKTLRGFRGESGRPGAAGAACAAWPRAHSEGYKFLVLSDRT